MPTAVLLAYQSDGSVQEFPLKSERIVIGRSEECDLIVEGRLISRQHACILKTGQGYLLEDLNSHNGTTINGKRLSGKQFLHDSDVIALGGVGRLVFCDSESTSTFVQPSAVGIWLDNEAQDVWVDGQCLAPKLSPAQFKLLQTLNARPDQIISRTEIVAAIWPDISDGVSEEAVDAIIKRVRARLAEIPNGESYLVTLRGRGLVMRRPTSLNDKR
ncbi:MAG: FHA domain-containing protein [Anaerolineaceae bacterium]|nr:FHA domain-containing protein [Anaerolineaceae bacterium]